MTPISSIDSFMHSSRCSQQSGSLLEDTTLRNTFHEFSMLSSEECVYHLGGLSDTCTEKYHGETGHSERVGGSQAQLKGRGYQSARLKSSRG